MVNRVSSYLPKVGHSATVNELKIIFAVVILCLNIILCFVTIIYYTDYS